MADLVLAVSLVGGVLGCGLVLALELRSWWRSADSVALFIVEGEAFADCEAGRAVVLFGIAPTGLMSFGCTQRAPEGVQ